MDKYLEVDAWISRWFTHGSGWISMVGGSGMLQQVAGEGRWMIALVRGRVMQRDFTCPTSAFA